MFNLAVWRNYGEERIIVMPWSSDITGWDFIRESPVALYDLKVGSLLYFVYIIAVLSQYINIYAIYSTFML